MGRAAVGSASVRATRLQHNARFEPTGGIGLQSCAWKDGGLCAGAVRGARVEGGSAEAHECVVVMGQRTSLGMGFWVIVATHWLAGVSERVMSLFGSHGRAGLSAGAGRGRRSVDVIEQQRRTTPSPISPAAAATAGAAVRCRRFDVSCFHDLCRYAPAVVHIGHKLGCGLCPARDPSLYAICHSRVWALARLLYTIGLLPRERRDDLTHGVCCCRLLLLVGCVVRMCLGRQGVQRSASTVGQCLLSLAQGCWRHRCSETHMGGSTWMEPGSGAWPGACRELEVWGQAGAWGLGRKRCTYGCGFWRQGGVGPCSWR